MILEMQLVLVYALSVMIMLVIQSYLATRQHGIKTLLEYREHITLTGVAGQELYCLFGTCFASSNGFGFNWAKLKRNRPSPPNIFNSKNFIFYSLFVLNYLG